MVTVAVPSVLAASGGARSGGVDAAFYPVFAVFVVGFVALAVVTLRWAVRRDRAGRAEWVRRHQSAGDALRPPLGRTRSARPPQTNGHRPRRPDQEGREPERPR